VPYDLSPFLDQPYNVQILLLIFIKQHSTGGDSKQQIWKSMDSPINCFHTSTDCLLTIGFTKYETSTLSPLTILHLQYKMAPCCSKEFCTLEHCDLDKVHHKCCSCKQKVHGPLCAHADEDAIGGPSLVCFKCKSPTPHDMSDIM